MMPSPSTGALTLDTKAKTMYRGGERAGERDRPSGVTAGRGVPAEKEKEQLRRNLSLLKKKMHSQAGSRRSQVGGWRLYVPVLVLISAFFSTGSRGNGLGGRYSSRGPTERHRPVRAQGATLRPVHTR